MTDISDLARVAREAIECEQRYRSEHYATAAWHQAHERMIEAKQDFRAAASPAVVVGLVEIAKAAMEAMPAMNLADGIAYDRWLKDPEYKGWGIIQNARLRLHVAIEVAQMKPSEATNE